MPALRSPPGWPGAPVGFAAVRTFTCSECGNLLVFDNSRCLRCGTPQSFSPERMDLVGRPAHAEAVCGNADLIGCTWLAREPGGLCLSCRLTRTRPGDDDTAGLRAFAGAERDKRRLVYQLLDLGLPVVPRDLDPAGLAFDLLSSRDGPVSTGHADGVVTIDLAEGHDPHREAVRLQMGEPYRTMLGHLRHEVGHYYFRVLVEARCPQVAGEAGRTAADPGPSWARGRDSLARFRGMFGDEGADYPDALARHYAQGPPAEWAQRHVSAYATAHPWEDWAETFAHYLHIRDTLQSASAYGMVVTGPATAPAELVELLRSDPAAGQATRGFAEIVSAWLPLTYALNAVNRSMGKDDLYPFLLTQPVIGKLAFVHALVAPAGRAPGSVPDPERAGPAG